MYHVTHAVSVLFQPRTTIYIAPLSLRFHWQAITSSTRYMSPANRRDHICAFVFRLTAAKLRTAVARLSARYKYIAKLTGELSLYLCLPACAEAFLPLSCA